jgi:hypothetical protein
MGLHGLLTGTALLFFYFLLLQIFQIIVTVHINVNILCHTFFIGSLPEVAYNEIIKAGRGLVCSSVLISACFV